MRTYILPQKDSTIYERFPTHNAGLDEILELGKLKDTLDQNVMYASSSARAIISFDLEGRNYTSSAQYYLNLRLANAESVKRYQKVEVYPVSTEWVEGSGYFYQDAENVEDGVSWNAASRFVPWSAAGGDHAASPTASVLLSAFPLSDIRIDVTNIIAPVISESNLTPWEGLLVQFPREDELDSGNRANIKIFSSNTHTVFSPTLEVVYDDQIFETGSLKPIPNANVSTIARNLKQVYTAGDIEKVYLVVRDPYPDKKYDAAKRYKNMYYLPQTSYFRLRDQVSGVVLQNFDQYSAINCDASGSYIYLNTTGLNVNRQYTLDIKVVNQNTTTFFPDFKYTFWVNDNG